MTRNEILTAPTIAYCSCLGGVDIKKLDLETGYCYCVSGAWGSHKSPHIVKIRYTSKGDPYIVVDGRRVPFSECIRA